MKFLCDNCKAKYQIGDDKVAGKTVRMKCRRCGHLIQVSASVTESSVARRMSLAGDPAAAASDEGAAPKPAPAPAATPAKPPHPGSMLEEEDENERTVMMSRPSQLPLKPAASSLGPPLGKSGAAGPPRPAAGAPNAPRPASGAIPIGGARTAATAAARPLGPQRAALAPVPTQRADATPAAEPEASPAPGSSGMAGAFARAVTEQPAASLRQAQTHSEDWYVGVAGVPLGPIRLSVVKEKAMAGAVDESSLVWREGFDEWQPLRNFPELLEVVTEARSSSIPGRRSSASLRTPTPVPFSSPLSPAPRSARAPEVASAPVPVAAAASAAAAAIDAPGPAEPAPAAAASLGVMADPFAAPRPAGSPDAAKPAAPAVIEPMRDPFSRAQDAPSDGRVSSPPDSMLVPGRSRRRGMHPMAYAFIAMAAVFGGVAAFVLLTPKPVAPVIVVQQAPPAPTAAPTAAATTEVASAASVEVQVGDPATPAVRGPAVAAGPRPTSEPKPAGTGAAIDTSGFGVPGGPVGPSAAGPSGASGPSAGGQLSGGEINGVVSQNQAMIRRKCWQPALDSRPKDGAKSARVSTTITIGASGNVDNVSAGGGDAFPGLASCIASRIKGWKFPPSGGSTTVNVPFSFIEQ